MRGAILHGAILDNITWDAKTYLDYALIDAKYEKSDEKIWEDVILIHCDESPTRFTWLKKKVRGGSKLDIIEGPVSSDPLSGRNGGLRGGYPFVAYDSVTNDIIDHVINYLEKEFPEEPPKPHSSPVFPSGKGLGQAISGLDYTLGIPSE